MAETPKGVRGAQRLEPGCRLLAMVPVIALHGRDIEKSTCYERHSKTANAGTRITHWIETNYLTIPAG